MVEKLEEEFTAFEPVDEKKDFVHEIKINSVVQINEKHTWVGCLVQVSEVKHWGIQGFVEIPTQGRAYMRLNKGEYEYVGEAVLTPGE